MTSLPEGVEKFDGRYVQHGVIGELKSQAYFTEKGFQVFTPLNHMSQADFIIERNRNLYRVQSKAFQVYKSTNSLAESSRVGTIRVDRRRNRQGGQTKEKYEYYDMDYINILIAYIYDIKELIFVRKDDFEVITPRGTKPTSIQIRVFGIEEAQRKTRNSLVRPYTDFTEPEWLNDL